MGPGLFLAAFAAFLKTACPTVSFDDSGEAVLAARQLGVMHPPGYPAFILLGRLALLIPAGAPEFRLSLLAAALAAGAACALFGLWRAAVPHDSARADGVGWAACLLAALTTGVWAQATTAKGGVYALNALLAFGALALSWSGARGAAGAWLAAGLAVSNHWMSALGLLPALALAGWRAGRAGTGRAAVLLGLGLSCYLAQPLSTAHAPFLDWGRPATAARWWRHVTRAQYGAPAGGEAAARPGERLAALGVAAAGAGPWPVLVPLGVVGAVALVGAAPASAAAVLAYPVALAGSLLAYPVMRERAPWYFEVFFSPGAMLLVWLAMFGALVLAGSRPRLRTAILAAVLAASAAALPARWTRCDRSRELLTDDAARNLAATARRPGLLFAASDAVVFGSWNAWQSGGRIRGLAVVPVPLLPMPWIAESLAQVVPELRAPYPAPWAGAEAVPALLRAWCEANAGRLGLQALRSPTIARAFPARAVGRAGWFVLPPGRASAHSFRVPPPERLRERGLFGLELRREPRKTASIQPLYFAGWLAWSNALTGPGRGAADARAADRLLERAGRLAEGAADAAAVELGRGNVAVQLNRPVEAERRFRAAAALAPDLAAARRTLARLLIRVRRDEAAAGVIRELMRIAPGSEEAQEVAPLLRGLEPRRALGR